MDMARLEIPVSGWTCFRTGLNHISGVFAGLRVSSIPL